MRASSLEWTADLDHDWRRAIAVSMLQGAAVHTAIVDEQMAEGLFPGDA
jgi:hypothetical protein